MRDLTRDAGAGSRAHSALIAAIEISIGAQPDVFLLHVNVFSGQRAGTETWTRSAPKGTPDFLCCVRNLRSNLGVFLAMDAKTGNACLTKEQRNFAAAIARFGGGFFAEVHSVEDAIAAVEKVRSFGCEHAPVASSDPAAGARGVVSDSERNHA